MTIKLFASLMIIAVGTGGMAYAQGMQGHHPGMGQDDRAVSDQRDYGGMRGGMMQDDQDGQDDVARGRGVRMTRQGRGMMMDHGMNPGGGPGRSMDCMMPDDRDDSPRGRRMGGGMMGSGGMMGGHGQMGGRGMMGNMMGAGMSHQGMMDGRMGGGGAMAPGMMGGGQPGSGAWFGSRVAPVMNLSADDVRGYLDDRVKRLGNKRLKVGDVNVTDDGTVIADIVTVDNSLVQRLKVDRHSGAIDYEN